MVKMSRLAIGLSFLLSTAAVSTQANAQADVLKPADAPQLQSDEPVATLYGQSFTLDMTDLQGLYGDRAGAVWSEISNRIPEALPGVFDGSNQKDMSGVLATTGQMAPSYKSLYECTVYDLAEKLVADGYLSALATNDAQLEFVNETVSTWDTERQVDYAYAEVDSWFRNNTWQANVEAYNERRSEDQPLLRPFMFVHPNKVYETSRALFALDLMIRNSPEVEQAGLTEHGVMPQSTPTCFQDAETSSGEREVSEDHKASQWEVIRRAEENGAGSLEP